MSARPADRGRQETVLVVDDRPEVAALSREMLKGLGHTVHVAGNAREALDLQRKHQDDWTPDLLFSDLIIPSGVNSFGLAREMRKRLPPSKSC